MLSSNSISDLTPCINSHLRHKTLPLNIQGMNTPDDPLQHYTSLLYDHKFDIDDVILALCGEGETRRWLLSTRDGRLLPADEAVAVRDGDDNNHWHEIHSLPNSYIKELTNHEKCQLLSDDELSRLDTLLKTATSPAAFPAHFADDRLGGWLRERIKEEALEWLDMRGLIPPSMKHVYDVQAAADRQPTDKHKINIAFDN